MRLTRAAQRAQQDVEEPTTDAPEVQDRNPLNEISPNASPKQVVPEGPVPKKTPARSKSKKGGKKGAKGKKAKAVEEEEQAPAVVEDEPVATNLDEHAPEAEPATVATDDAANTPANEERPTSPPPKAARLTRRQLAKQEEELKQSQRARSPSRQDVPEAPTEHVAQAPVREVQEDAITSQKLEDTTAGEEEEAMEAQVEIGPEPEIVSQEVSSEQESKARPLSNTHRADQIIENTNTPEAPPAEPQNEVAPEAEGIQQQIVAQEESGVNHSVASLDLEVEAVTPSVEITSEPEPKTLATERPSDASRTPVMSPTPSRRASRSPSKSPMRIEESIEALDALEEALENVGKAVSHFDSSTEDKSPRKKSFPKDVATPNVKSKTPRKTPMFTRVSKTPNAVPKSMKPASSLARASSVRAAPTKELRKGSTETVDYLASKRRPVSVSFPTPPPPPKGRAPTKPTFQLSSEVTAAKLKAEKEERIKRQAEREADGAPIKQRPISMPPIAKSTKPLTKATFQLPGEAIAAKLKAQKEERLKREAENAQAEQPKARPVSITMPPAAVKSTKPPTKANFQLPGEAIAAKLRVQREERQKREEEAEVAKKAATASKIRPTTTRKPIALPTRAPPGITIPPPPPKPENAPPAPMRSTSLASKRSSIQLSTTTASRSTSVSTTSSNPNRASLFVAKATVTPVDAVQQKLKGKEVFNRDKMEKEAREREKREKEEAAKMARAQAAERGRIASREWAERQRRKMIEAVRGKAEAA